MLTTSVSSEASSASPSVPPPATTPTRSTVSGPSSFCTSNQVIAGVPAVSAGAARARADGVADALASGEESENVCADPLPSTVVVSPSPAGTPVTGGALDGRSMRFPANCADA